MKFALIPVLLLSLTELSVQDEESGNLRWGKPKLRYIWRSVFSNYADGDSIGEQGEVDTDSPITPPPVPSPTKLPTVSPVVIPLPDHCGCFECDEAAWNKEVTDQSGKFSCGTRVQGVQNQLSITEEEACLVVAGDNLPTICGPACNPRRCDGRFPEETPAPSITPNNIEMLPETDIDCFPEFSSRQRYENVWNNFTVEVKENPIGFLCLPFNNRFKRETVSLVNDELTMQFKKDQNFWTGSEVRIVLPQDQMPYTYGKFSFSVKAVRVVKAGSGTVVSNILPQGIAFGMFTRDPTESLEENFRHEVYMEISRWNRTAGMDLQFLVSPLGLPQVKRFFSGGNGYDQSGHVWEFDWAPTSINWSGPNNITHSYSTQQAYDFGIPDRVQCLPANVEVRLNLYNLGGLDTPTGMQNNDVVEVVIDRFSYTPSGETAVADGETCSKHCQCESESLCINAKCTSTP
jgi:hypothetical protein